MAKSFAMAAEETLLAPAAAVRSIRNAVVDDLVINSKIGSRTSGDIMINVKLKEETLISVFYLK